jgi:uncharacterized oligopeptide transporter (OPT) family protein
MELTPRAVLTGMVLGGVLSLCNIYSGLKIGWSFNVSITSCLLSFALWQGAHHLFATRPWGMLENNINQAAASAAANISSCGLSAAIPALTLLTGRQLAWPTLATWTCIVGVTGVAVAIGLRRQLIIVDQLPFPAGVATAETLREMYARGREAVRRVMMLVGGAVFAAAAKLLTHVTDVKPLPLPGRLGPATLGNLGFALDPSPLMIGVGVIVGPRAGASLLVGAIAGWGVLGPIALARGWADPGGPDTVWFGSMNKWMLWPGVAMMVTSSLASLAFSWRSMLNAFRRTGGDAPDPADVSKRTFIGALAVCFAAATIAQAVFFGIGLWAAAIGVVLTMLMAVVAGRVSGETNITPIGPMGKVTQLVFGVLTPGDAAANLMAANVTGGAAAQCADLLHDLKTGHLIGASAKRQAVSQAFGVLAGALCGSAGYLLLIPDPQRMLLTEAWPAPAAAAWKAVAEIFAKGIDAMPTMSLEAASIGGVLGVLLAIAESLLPERAARFVPSPSSIGLALVMSPYFSMSMFAGAMAGVAAKRLAPAWSARFLVILAAGVIAGESLAGVGLAISDALGAMRGN